MDDGWIIIFYKEEHRSYSTFVWQGNQRLWWPLSAFYFALITPSWSSIISESKEYGKKTQPSCPPLRPIPLLPYRHIRQGCRGFWRLHRSSCRNRTWIKSYLLAMGKSMELLGKDVIDSVSLNGVTLGIDSDELWSLKLDFPNNS